MERDIIHFSIPSFPIALARVTDSSLRERPVAIAPGHSERALLQYVSTEARSDGVFEGMPVYRAVRLCPSLTLLMPNPGLVSGGTRKLISMTKHFTPLWEPASAGRIFLDMTGCSRLYGPGRDIAMRLEREIEDSMKLKGSAGVAGNKLVSKIASGCLERPGICDVLRGSEAQFISPMCISVLPGIGKTRENILLSDLNIHRVGQVADLKVSQLKLLFGPFAPLLHQRAAGIDPSPVKPPELSMTVSEESYMAQEDNDDSLLLAEMCRLVGRCGFRLRTMGKAAAVIRLTVHFADGISARRAHSFRAPENMDPSLAKASEKLLEAICSRRVRVRGMRLDCRKLYRHGGQADLFAPRDSSSCPVSSLQFALDSVRTKYGADAVRRADTIEN